ncbi:unnamed protein product [Prunus brigantina]
MLREIGDGPQGGTQSIETSLDKEYEIPSTRNVAVDEALRAQPKSKGPMDRFVTLEARQNKENMLANLFWRHLMVQKNM